MTSVRRIAITADSDSLTGSITDATDLVRGNFPHWYGAMLQTCAGLLMLL